MTQVKESLFDGALVLAGTGVSVLFISTDGNGQNPGPVAEMIGFVVLVNGVFSFAAAKFMRGLLLEWRRARW